MAPPNVNTLEGTNVRYALSRACRRDNPHVPRAGYGWLDGVCKDSGGGIVYVILLVSVGLIRIPANWCEVIDA